MVCHKTKSSELSEKYSSATLKSLKKWGQILLWKSVFMTKSVMHIVTRARCFLCSGSDYSKQKFKAHLPHQLQILSWWCREGEEQGWDPPHPGGFRWDFHPPLTLGIPQPSLNSWLCFSQNLCSPKSPSAPGRKKINWLKFHSWSNPQITLGFIPIQTIHGASLTIVICTEITPWSFPLFCLVLLA